MNAPASLAGPVGAAVMVMLLQDDQAADILAQLDPQTARKRWIAAMKPRGTITIDPGASAALKNGKSLLPAGITALSGRFGRGEPVAILDPDGHKLGQGLTRYTSAETTRIRGRHSAEIEAILGYPGRAVLIHRDDMAL